MAAFSFQQLHHPFLLDSVFWPNSPVKMSGLLEESNNNTACFSQFYQPEPIQEEAAAKSSCLDHSAKVTCSNNEPSVTNKSSLDSPSVSDHKLESGVIDQVSSQKSPMEKKRRNREVYSMTSSAQSKNTREIEGKRQKKDAKEKKPREDKKDKKKAPAEEAPTGYIHVRARRGQATDSHSLAERVRREKISERMKMLQALVPGCDKVTGKALMLDEIINYVQSLQNQVEFLSMKLASLNPLLYDFGMDLDAFIVRPDKNLNGFVSPLPNVHQQCPPTVPTVNVSDASNNLIMENSANGYPLLETSVSFMYPQGQMPNILSQ